MLLLTKDNYAFIITAHFNQSEPPSQNPQCPRVNTWSTGQGIGPYITASSTQTDKYGWTNSQVGVDVFYWNGTDGRTRQAVTVNASGYNGTPTDLVDRQTPSQNKYQLVYSRPGTYYIDIDIHDYP